MPVLPKANSTIPRTEIRATIRTYIAENILPALKEATRSGTDSEVIEFALLVYDSAIAHKKAGGKVFVRDRTGKEAEIALEPGDIPPGGL